jgi:glyceraldehyde 3-phosphate dehydrogenase
MVKKSPQKKITAGINGFGRFGLHLIKYWLDRADSANFEILYINDDFLKLKKSFDILITDKYVNFEKYKVLISQNKLIFEKPDGFRKEIEYTNSPKDAIPWTGNTDLFLECSGKNPSINDCQPYITGKTKLVIISQTSWDAQKTLVYGFNHTEFNKNLKIVSYGSCTVNSYVALANYIHKKYTILDSDINYIHNLPQYQLENFNTLNRKSCSLEKSGPLLLNFINEKNFTINYTIIPYSGNSTLDFRFRLQKKVDLEKFLQDLKHQFVEGELKDLYQLEEVDTGPEAHVGTPFSAVFIKDKARIVGDNVYLFGYFDNENSANRYYDLTNYISTHL